jgi:hypothetical protein
VPNIQVSCAKYCLQSKEVIPIRNAIDVQVQYFVVNDEFLLSSLEASAQINSATECPIFFACV